RRVAQDERAVHRDRQLDEILNRVVGTGKPVDLLIEQPKRLAHQGRDQAILGSEEAVDGPDGGVSFIRHGPDRDRVRTSRHHDPFSGVEKRSRRQLIVLPRPPHGGSLSYDVSKHLSGFTVTRPNRSVRTALLAPSTAVFHRK